MLCIVSGGFLLFFINQKTAYELRISDLSSDVCSSDLSSAAFGLIAALIVVLVTRTSIGEDAFGEWGWRVPFLVSAGLLAVSIWMRLKLTASPTFQQMTEERSEERRVGKECASTCRSRWSPSH